MSDNRGLIGKLLKLASANTRIENGWRRIGEASDGDPVALILREIEETQLPRDLSFRSEKGRILQLEAGNGRLRRAVSASWAELSDFNLAAGENGPGLTEAEVETVGNLLLDFVPESQEIWVQSKRIASNGDGAQIGVQAHVLARAFGVDLSDLSAERMTRAYQAFVQEICARSDQWLRIDDDEVTAAFGAGAEEWAALDWQPFRHGSAALQGIPTLCILGAGANTGNLHLIAVCGASRFVARLSKAKLPDINQRWRALGL